MSLLAQARMSLGVALGHLLPDEQLATAARWTGRALRIAWHLGTGRCSAWSCGCTATSCERQGIPLPGSSGSARPCRSKITRYVRVPGWSCWPARPPSPGSRPVRRHHQPVRPGGREASAQDVLFSPFSVREVRLRGLLATGRDRSGCRMAERCPADSGPPSPHWRVIERITTAEVLARSADERTAEPMLTAAISDAETLRLPHQVQRIIRLASEPGVLAGQAVHQQARAALTRLDRQLTGTAIQTGCETARIRAGEARCRAVRAQRVGPRGRGGGGRRGGGGSPGQVRAGLVRAAAGGARRGS